MPWSPNDLCNDITFPHLIRRAGHNVGQQKHSCLGWHEQSSRQKARLIVRVGHQ